MIIRKTKFIFMFMILLSSINCSNDNNDRDTNSIASILENNFGTKIKVNKKVQFSMEGRRSSYQIIFDKFPDNINTSDIVDKIASKAAVVFYNAVKSENISYDKLDIIFIKENLQKSYFKKDLIKVENCLKNTSEFLNFFKNHDKEIKPLFKEDLQIENGFMKNTLTKIDSTLGKIREIKFNGFIQKGENVNFIINLYRGDTILNRLDYQVDLNDCKIISFNL